MQKYFVSLLVFNANNDAKYVIKELEIVGEISDLTEELNTTRIEDELANFIFYPNPVHDKLFIKSKFCLFHL